jgi:hypothetical protein
MIGLAALLVVASAASPAEPNEPVEPGPVILVTIDGVRFREIFGEGALLPKLAARAARGGFLAGDAARGDPFLVTSPAACSLPGYQDILTGQAVPCADNHCGRVGVETVLERARRELGLPPSAVAVFAGWPPIAQAVERAPGSLTVNVGFEPFRAPFAPPDEATAALGRLQVEDVPPWPYRRDRYTWDLALRYLDRFHPRILYVGLGDPDEWAHLDDRDAYQAAVRALDDRLEALFERLAAMGEYGAGASVLVTTDHGRGEGEHWSIHGAGYPGSNLAWLFASTPATRSTPGGSGRGRLDQLSIRPTIEALLGLPPCLRCQPPIEALLPPGVADRLDRSRWGAGGP